MYSDKLAEITVGRYYAYKAKANSLDKEFWYDQNGIVVDPAYALLLDELAVRLASQPNGAEGDVVPPVMRSLPLKDIKRLCDLIVNSPPNTTIRGEIESIAFGIAQHPDILNCDNGNDA